MSGYLPGSGEGESSGGGMNALLAQLRGASGQQEKRINLEPSNSYGYYNNYNTGFQQAPQHQGYPPHSQQQGYQPPSVSSPLPTPPIFNQPPHHTSAVISPVETPQPRPTTGGAGRNTLLNLLKFQQPSTNLSKQPDPIGTPLPASREPSMSLPGPEAVGLVPSPLAHAQHLLRRLQILKHISFSY
jgi:hypothetical protein